MKELIRQYGMALKLQHRCFREERRNVVNCTAELFFYIKISY